MNFPLSDLTLIGPHIALTAAALLCLLAEAFGGAGRKGYLAWIGLAGIAVAAYLNGCLFGPPRLGFSRMLAGDSFAAFFHGIILVVGALTMLVSDNYLADEGKNHGEYYCLVLLSMVGMLLMAGATHLLVFFLGLETMSIAIYALAGFTRTAENAESSFKYFLLGGFSSAFLLYGIALVYAAVGSTQLQDVMAFYKAQPALTSSPLAVAGLALVLVGFCFKVAAVPFHVWTPDVYQGAPTSVTAFMATGVKAAAFAAFLRVFLTAFHGQFADWSQVLWVVAVLTMTMGNFAAILQTDVKRMLAYSSIAHAGYLLVGLVVGTPAAGSGMLFYLLSYAFMNIGAFGCVIMAGRQGQENTTLDSWAGFGFRFPALGIAMTLFMFAMAGIPPTGGFIGKFLIFKAAVKEGYVWLTILGVMNSAASVYYYLRVIVVMYFTEPAAGASPVEKLRSSALSVGAALISGVAILWLGVAPARVVAIAEEAVKIFS
ncbi:MAG: NADH-quinone oxidoreductase subunit N [Deltaproteobacteria bacterium]|nr:NADH-quinone oxidoreductase subunit N [Deltaproteobacteria bacterium]